MVKKAAKKVVRKAVKKKKPQRRNVMAPRRPSKRKPVDPAEQFSIRLEAVIHTYRNRGLSASDLIKITTSVLIDTCGYKATNTKPTEPVMPAEPFADPEIDPAMAPTDAS